MIEIRLLGHQSVQAADGREVLSVSAQPKRLALLIYLALSSARGDGFVSRDSLLSLFWPESDLDHSRNTLNQHIHALRRSLGSDVILSHGVSRIGLADGQFRCDAVEFQRAIKAQEWERALDLHEGEFLAGFFLSGMPELEKWLDNRRLTIQQQALDAAMALAHEAEAASNLSKAVDWYRRATRIKPDSEAAITALSNAIASAETVGPATVVGHESVHPSGVRTPAGAGVTDEAPKSWSAWSVAVIGVMVLVSGAVWLTLDIAPGRSDKSSGALTALTASSDDSRPSIAVLPFVNMSADGGQEYFSDGMTEELQATLARLPGLRVLARTSAFAYKDQNRDLRQIGSALGASYLIEGSVRREGDQLRITAQLIDAETGSHLWSEQYDRTLDSVFQIQTEIAEAIAGELHVPLSLADGSMPALPTTDMAAYDLYLAGRAQMRTRGMGLIEAIQFFDASIALDSSWAPAWASLAQSKELRIWFDETFDDGVWNEEQEKKLLTEAEQAAIRALELDPRNALALVALGSVQRDRGQWDESEASYLAAIELDPEEPEAHQQYSDLLGNLGRIAEAVRHADLATVLDPAPIRLFELGHALQYDDRLAEALEVYRLGTTLNADMTLPRLWLAIWKSSITAGQVQASIELGDVLIQGLGEWPGGSPRPAPAEMESFVAGIVAGDLTRIPVNMYGLMWPEHWMLVGQPDSAIAALYRYDMQDSIPYNAHIWHPSLDSLRYGPELQALLEPRGLGDVQALRTPKAARTRPLILGNTP